MQNFEDKLVEVCGECHQASCWHGEFMCFEARTAGTELKTVRELRKLGHENQDNWSDENLKKICGDPAPNGYATEEEPKTEMSIDTLTDMDMGDAIDWLLENQSTYKLVRIDQ